MVRALQRQPRGASQDPDRRAGQAPRRGPRRGRLRLDLPRVVLGGGQEDQRRHRPAQRGQQADGLHPRAHRRRRHDHALELPQRHDHQEGRSCPRRRYAIIDISSLGLLI